MARHRPCGRPLIHGSSEGRFTIRYAAGKLWRAEIEGAGYRHCPLAEDLARCSPDTMQEGWNTMPGGQEVFFIGTPSAGLWSTEEKLRDRNA